MNVLKEMLQHVGSRPIEAILVNLEWPLEEKSLRLKATYTPEEYRAFMQRLSEIDYDNCFGNHMVHGTIWFRDGTWSERVSYDGAEWWKHRSRPELP